MCVPTGAGPMPPRWPPAGSPLPSPPPRGARGSRLRGRGHWHGGEGGAARKDQPRQCSVLIDHAGRPVCKSGLCAQHSLLILHERLAPHAQVRGLVVKDRLYGASRVNGLSLITHECVAHTICMAGENHAILAPDVVASAGSDRGSRACPMKHTQRSAAQHRALKRRVRSSRRRQRWLSLAWLASAGA